MSVPGIMDAFVGTAGWSIGRADAAAFPADGSVLERYAQVFDAVEVNSSFHRPHRPATWARWAASVPAGFRFAVKAPKAITHGARLADAEELVARFADEIAALEGKLGVVLVQLPPSLGFDAAVAERFFAALRGRVEAMLACEPRHAGWFADDADALLAELGVARVAADPAPVPAAGAPGGWRGGAYWRLHGSPAMYRSAYGPDAIGRYADALRAAGCRPWCMFDNTAASAATGDALALTARLRARAAD